MHCSLLELIPILLSLLGWLIFLSMIKLSLGSNFDFLVAFEEYTVNVMHESYIANLL